MVDRSAQEWQATTWGAVQPQMIVRRLGAYSMDIGEVVRASQRHYPRHDHHLMRPDTPGTTCVPGSSPKPEPVGYPTN